MISIYTKTGERHYHEIEIEKGESGSIVASLDNAAISALTELEAAAVKEYLYFCMSQLENRRFLNV